MWASCLIAQPWLDLSPMQADPSTDLKLEITYLYLTCSKATLLDATFRLLAKYRHPNSGPTPQSSPTLALFRTVTTSLLLRTRQLYKPIDVSEKQCRLNNETSPCWRTPGMPKRPGLEPPRERSSVSVVSDTSIEVLNYRF